MRRQIAALAAGITTTMMAENELKEPNGPVDQLVIDDHNRRARSLRWAAGLSYGLAGAAAITGALLYFWSGEQSTPGNAHTTVGVSLDGVSLHGRF